MRSFCLWTMFMSRYVKAINHAPCRQIRHTPAAVDFLVKDVFMYLFIYRGL